MLAGSGLLQAQRHNASHLTLLVPPLAAYSIRQPETLEVTGQGAATKLAPLQTALRPETR